MRRTTPARWLVLAIVMSLALVATLRPATAAARAWLGVYTQEITDEIRDGMSLDGNGVLVNRVVPDSPADRAGVRKGDVITRFNSRSVASPSALADMVGNARDGQEIALMVRRDGANRTLSVTLADRPEGGMRDDSGDDDGDDDEDVAPPVPRAPRAPEAPEAPQAPKGKRDLRVKIVNPDGHGAPKVFRWEGDPDDMPGDVHEMLRGFDLNGGNLRGMRGLQGMRGLEGLNALPGMARGRLGVRIQDLDADLAAALDVPGGDGVLVVGVTKDSPAERAGLRSGDVILSVDGRTVSGAGQLVERIQAADGKVSLSVSRKGERRTVEADLGSRRSGAGDDEDNGRSEDRVRVYRSRDGDGANGDDLRKQMEELRQQLRELRRQLEDQRRN